MGKGQAQLTIRHSDTPVKAAGSLGKELGNPSLWYSHWGKVGGRLSTTLTQMFRVIGMRQEPQ